MRSLLLGSTLVTLLLAGCGGASKSGNESSGNASAPATEKAEALKLLPGQWESTQEIVDVKMSGLPQGASDAAMAQQMKGQRTTSKHCITPEQAADPSAGFLAAQKDAKCKNDRLTMKGGRFDTLMHCEMPQQPGAKMTMAMTGSYGADSYDLDVKVDTSGLPGGMAMAMTMKTAGKRIGDCPAGAK